METYSNHPPIHCFFLPPRGVRNPCYLVPDLSRWIKLLRCSPEKSFRSNGGFFGYRVQPKKLKMVASKIPRDNLVLNKSWNCEFQLLDQFILLWNKALCRIQMKFQGGYPRAYFCEWKMWFVRHELKGYNLPKQTFLHFHQEKSQQTHYDVPANWDILPTFKLGYIKVKTHTS